MSATSNLFSLRYRRKDSCALKNLPLKCVVESFAFSHDYNAFISIIKDFCISRDHMEFVSPPYPDVLKVLNSSRLRLG